MKFHARVAGGVQAAVQHARAVIATFDEVLEHPVSPSADPSSALRVSADPTQLRAATEVLERSLRELEQLSNTAVQAHRAWLEREAIANAEGKSMLASQARERAAEAAAEAASYEAEVVATRTLLAQCRESGGGAA